MKTNKITLKPKVAADRERHTLGQRRVLDTRLARALEDIERGRTYGPFDAVDEMAASIEANIKKIERAKRKSSRSDQG